MKRELHYILVFHRTARVSVSLPAGVGLRQLALGTFQHNMQVQQAIDSTDTVDKNW